MYDIQKCEKIKIDQGVFYLGESTEEKSMGYLELNPHTSLAIHNRTGGFENLTQIDGQCIMIVFDTPSGTNHKLTKGDQLKIEPEGTWHIHSNPFDSVSLTYWHFEGDIRHIIEAIRSGKK
jgi:hypothetical protein